MSFGWPRPEGAAFLDALHRIYIKFGDGKPHREARPAAPDNVKDEGIDVIAWRPSPDGLPGTHYVLGQVASGANWKEKSVLADAEAFHHYWFERPPSTEHQNAMFMPFCLEPKDPDQDTEAQEMLVDHMQRLTKKYGTILYRYRIASWAAEGIKCNEEGKFTIERIDELANVMEWVRTYSETLRRRSHERET